MEREHLVEVHAQVAPLLDEMHRLMRIYNIDHLDVSIGYHSTREFYVCRNAGEIQYNSITTRGTSSEWRTEVVNDEDTTNG